MSETYILDSNVFIQAKRFHYPMDVFPGFWDWLEEENANDNLYTLDCVKAELAAGNKEDELNQWFKAQDSDSWFIPEEDEETQECFIEIVNWVQESTHYTEAAKVEFFRGADPWLIAKAKSTGHTLVTQEKSDSQSKKKIFIPDVCRQFSVEYVDTITLIRNLKGRF